MTLVDEHTPDLEGCAPAQAAEADEDRLLGDPELRRETIGIVADRLGVPRDQAGRHILSLRSVSKIRQSHAGVTEIQPGEPGCPITFEDVKNCRVYPPDTVTIVETNVLLDADGKLLPVTTDGSVTNRIRVDDPGLADICALPRNAFT